MGALGVWFVFVQETAIHGWAALFTPGVIGIMLVGGVHGEAPPWLQGIAWGLTTAIAWWAIFAVMFHLARLAARGLRAS